MSQKRAALIVLLVVITFILGYSSLQRTPTVQAQITTPTLSFNVPPGPQNPTTPFDVDIYIEEVVNMGAVEIVLEYDPSLVQLTGVTFSDFLGDTSPSCDPNTSRCVMTLGPIDHGPLLGATDLGAFSYGTGAGVNGEGVLATLHLQPTGLEGSFSLHLANPLASDVDVIDPVIPITEDAILAFSFPPPPTATPGPTNTPGPIPPPNHTIHLPIIQNSSGGVNKSQGFVRTLDPQIRSKNSSDSSHSSYPPVVGNCINADINGDGTTNIVDILLVGIARGSEPGDPLWNPALDLNNDLIVDDADAFLAAGAWHGIFSPCVFVQITSPENLSLFNTPLITVTGTISATTGGGIASVTVNGITATLTVDIFSAVVPIVEGNNIITAVAKDSENHVGTSSIRVTRDTTSPTVMIYSPPAGTTLYEPTLSISGMINDMVVGTVNGEQATVTVNGTEAQVANRSFLATNVPLIPGINTLTAVGADQVGNTVTTSITVTFQSVLDLPHISSMSGNNQTGVISTTLSSPLVVQLTDENNNPVPNETVIFKVIQNSGKVSDGAASERSLAVTTDAQGQAQVTWTLGTRSGPGNNTVQATAVGYAGIVYFTANTLSSEPAKVQLDAGNSQVGVINQPLPRPFVVVVTDQGFNRLPNVPVTFTVVEGAGGFDGQTSVTVMTDSDGRGLAVLSLGPDVGYDNNVVEASYTGYPGLPAVFVASGRVAGNPANTQISGVVLDNSNVPIEGVTVQIEGTNLVTQSDTQGQFVLESVPVGHLHLIADGATAQRPGTWPMLMFEMVTVAGRDNTVGMPIFLLPLNLAEQLCVSETEGGVLTLAEVPGFSLTIPAGTTTFPDGSREGCVNVSVVHGDKVPMVPNFGQQPRFVITIQPVGVLFVPAAQMTMPNTDGMAPGEVTEMYSFDHDLGQFVSIGTGAVSEDGTMVVSDPGVGVIKGGWHCGGNPSATGGAQNAQVVVAPFNIFIRVGQTAYAYAAGSPAPSGNPAYTWSSANPSVASVSPTIPNTGLITGISPGTATITVVYKCQSGATASATVNVTIVEYSWVTLEDPVEPVLLPPEVNQLKEPPIDDHVAHRTIKAKFEPASYWSGKTVEWTYTPTLVRGNFPSTAPNTFLEFASGYNFIPYSGSSSGISIVASDGTVAIRVNMPPIGFNAGSLDLHAFEYPQFSLQADFIAPAIVVIDPGHGGTANSGIEPCISSWNNSFSWSYYHDPGGSNWVYEKDLTLIMGILVQNQLQTIDYVKPYLTREGNINPDLCKRSHVARDNGADIFLSIHFNGDESQQARGSEIFVRAPVNSNTDADEEFSNRVLDFVISQIPNGVPHNGGLQSANFGVLSDVALGYNADYQPIRSALLEVEFIDTQEVEEIFWTGSNANTNRYNVAFAIVNGIIEDLENQPIAQFEYPESTGEPENLILSNTPLIAPLSEGDASSISETPTSTQLNENCTISILNRTGNVQPDGSWAIDNVPANFGPVRAHATCVEDGITTSGQSDFFLITENIVNGLNADIQIGEVSPIPSTLAVTTSTPILPSIGATTQLTVIATYPDGSTGDVTLQSSGTSYVSSNASVATVSQDGLVTAVSSGVVFVTVTNEGTFALIQIQVVLSGDTDGDGIPDDIELANGLDPNNPVDGQEDPDADGLTNFEELMVYATNFQDPDTDNDGLLDGEEVVPGDDGYITNPLLPDTDGDLIKDGLEITIGSDPTDPNDPSDYSQVLETLEVAPNFFVLAVNTILGEASKQLAVTGNFIDGTVVDLTSTSVGTNYTSSDLLICNFGSPDGNVFAGADGTCTITITNSGFSTVATGVVQTFAPTALSYIDIPGYAYNVDVSGNYVFVAAGSTGLQVVDVSNRSAPFIATALDTSGTANDVRVVGNLAFIADGSSGLQIVDISSPTAPGLVGFVDTPGIAADVMVSGAHAFIADGVSGLQVIDISNPTSPAIVGALDTPGTAQGVAVTSNEQWAFVADGVTGIRVINLSNLTIVGNLDTGDARDVDVEGNIVFVADYASSLTSVDITTPSNPVLLDTTPLTTGGLLEDVAVWNDFAFGADVYFVNGVPIVYVGDPVNLSPRAILDFSQYRDDNGTGIAVDDHYVYLTAQAGANTRLYIGQYLMLEDTAGISPTVTITSPGAGDAVIEGSTIQVTVAAADDVAVSAVHFLLDGKVVATDTATPFSINLTVPISVTAVTLGATAIDLGGNVGVAEDVPVDVIPDPLTTVSGRVLYQSTPVENAIVSVLGLAGTTNVSGTFMISGVPTILGNIKVQATGKISDTILTGVSVQAPPVLAGTTDVGDIVISTEPLYPGPTFAVGDGAVSVALGYLDDDTILDIVTTNLYSDNISVLLGNGNGIFQPQLTFAVGDGPVSVALGYLDDDTILDIVTANIYSDNVSVLVGNEDGTFQPHVTFSVGDNPTSVALGYLDDDAILDVVTANFYSDNISIRLGNGDGTFQSQVTFAVGNGPHSVAIGYLDDDTILDIVAANYFTDNVSVLLGDGDGTFQSQGTFAVGDFPFFAVLGHLDDDLILDIVTANSNVDTISVLLGNGNGTFQPQVTFAVGDNPTSVALGYLDDDTIPDIVVANKISDNASVLIGNGDGTFQPQVTFAVGDSPEAIALGQMNGDSSFDLVTANNGNFAFYILLQLGNGDGTFQSQVTFDVGDSPSSVALGRVDNGTIFDLVTANLGSDTVSVILVNGDGTFQSQVAFDVGDGPSSVALGYLDDDMVLDIVTANSNADTISVLLGNGDGTFQPQVTFAVGDGPSSVALGYLDDDMVLDIVTANTSADTISVLLGNGDGTFQSQATFAVGDGPSSVALGYLDDDILLDIVTANLHSDNVSVLIGKGDGTFQPQATFDVGDSPSSVALGRVDNDIVLDIVTANKTSDNVSLLIGNGDGMFQSQAVFAVGDLPQSVVLGDINGDDVLDILTANFYSDNVSVLLGNGDGTFQPQVAFLTGNSPHSVAIGDVSGDSTLDIVAANFSTHNISVLMHR